MGISTAASRVSRLELDDIAPRISTRSVNMIASEVATRDDGKDSAHGLGGIGASSQRFGQRIPRSNMHCARSACSALRAKSVAPQRMCTGITMITTSRYRSDGFAFCIIANGTKRTDPERT